MGLSRTLRGPVTFHEDDKTNNLLSDHVLSTKDMPTLALREISLTTVNPFTNPFVRPSFSTTHELPCISKFRKGSLNDPHIYT